MIWTRRKNISISAAQLDPNDALNFYGQGLVAMDQAGNAGVPPGALNAFEKAASR